MTITFPKPTNTEPFKTILKIPKVPGWLFVAALVAEYALMNSGGTSQPDCTINVQRIHESTYSAEYQNRRELKIKITTKCISDQAYTSLNVNLEEMIAGKKNRIVRRFDSVLQKPEPSNPKVAVIENLTIPCNFSGIATYSGSAIGEVHLKNGKISKIAGHSKSNIVNCRISAK